MDFLASPAGVLVILLVVVIAAFNFQPSELGGAWRELTERYATDYRPAYIQFPQQSLEIGTVKTLKPSGLPGFQTMDVAVNDDGFWLIYESPDPNKDTTCLLLPWDCVRYRQSKGDRQNFQMRGKDPIELWVSAELGDAMQRRADRFEIEEQL